MDGKEGEEVKVVSLLQVIHPLLLFPILYKQTWLSDSFSRPLVVVDEQVIDN